MSLPAWSEAFVDDALAEVVGLPIGERARDWAWAGATGRGIKVAVIDSGIDADHPWVDGVAGAVSVEVDPDDPTRTRYVEGPHEDFVGHGTACAGSSGGSRPRPRSTASACSGRT